MVPQVTFKLQGDVLCVSIGKTKIFASLYVIKVVYLEIYRSSFAHDILICQLVFCSFSENAEIIFLVLLLRKASFRN